MILAFDLAAYLPILVLIGVALGFLVVNMLATHLLGPRKSGESKDVAYESGMNPVGTARKRFNVRFYILAMTFLVFDVEIIFLYPWAVTYTQLEPGSQEALLFLGRIMFFIGTSIGVAESGPGHGSGSYRLRLEKALFQRRGVPTCFRRVPLFYCGQAAPLEFSLLILELETFPGGSR